MVGSAPLILGMLAVLPNGRDVGTRRCALPCLCADFTDIGTKVRQLAAPVRHDADHDSTFVVEYVVRDVRATNLIGTGATQQSSPASVGYEELLVHDAWGLGAGPQVPRLLRLPLGTGWQGCFRLPTPTGARRLAMVRLMRDSVVSESLCEAPVVARGREARRLRTLLKARWHRR